MLALPQGNLHHHCWCGGDCEVCGGGECHLEAGQGEAWPRSPAAVQLQQFRLAGHCCHALRERLKVGSLLAAGSFGAAWQGKRNTRLQDCFFPDVRTEVLRLTEGVVKGVESFRHDHAEAGAYQEAS